MTHNAVSPADRTDVPRHRRDVRKPNTCPSCGSSPRIARILYGEPRIRMQCAARAGLKLGPGHRFAIPG